MSEPVSDETKAVPVPDQTPFRFEDALPTTECPSCKGMWVMHNEWQRGYCQGLYRQACVIAQLEATILELQAESKHKWDNLDKAVRYECDRANNAEKACYSAELMAEGFETQLHAAKATIREKDEALRKAKHGLESAGMGCRYIDTALGPERTDKEGL